MESGSDVNRPEDDGLAGGMQKKPSHQAEVKHFAQKFREEFGVPDNVDFFRGRTADSMQSILSSEQAERVNNLKFVELTLDPEHPMESPAYRQIKHLYESNLVPDEAFIALEHGDAEKFRRMLRRGGMLNRFAPNAEEYALYPDGYETVSDQLIADMTGKSGRPGEYRVFGLAEEGAENPVHAYVSLRMPPVDPAERAMYAQFLRRMLVGERNDENALIRGKEMHYESWWNIDYMVREQLPNWAEIDTINVKNGYRGASFRLLHNVVKRLEEERGQEQLPGGVFCYRFNGAFAKFAGPSGNGQQIPIGRNIASAKLFEEDDTLQFRKFAERYDQNERVVRQIESEGAEYQFVPLWTYLYSSWNDMKKNLDRCVAERKFK